MSPLRSNPSGRTRAERQQREDGGQQRDQPSGKRTLHRGRGGEARRDLEAAHLHLGDEEFERHCSGGDAESARQPGENRHLQQRDQQDRARGNPETALDGGGRQALAGEGPRHAEDADPPEQQNHESREAQVVLAPAYPAGDPVAGLAEGPHPDRMVLERGLESRGEPADRRLAVHGEQDLPAGAFRDVQEAGFEQIGEPDQHPRPAPEEIDPGARFLEQVAAHFEGLPAEEDRIADLEAQPDPHLGPDQRPPSGEQLRPEAGPRDLHLAVERERAVHGLELHHRAPQGVVGRAREGRDLGRARHPGERVSGGDVVDDGLDFVVEALPGGNGHVGGHQEARLVGKRRLQAVGRRAEHHDRRDADAHRDEEEREPAGGRTKFPERHPERESHYELPAPVRLKARWRESARFPLRREASPGRGAGRGFPAPRKSFPAPRKSFPAPRKRFPAPRKRTMRRA